MSTWDKIIEKAFTGNQRIRIGHPNCIVYTATPNAAVTAPKGTFCWDKTNSNVYVNTDGATAWTQIDA